MMNASASVLEHETAVAEILDCLTSGKPRSFFLFAGAGSGKTRALVDVIEKVRDSRGHKLRLRGQRIGVITYTNAACDEIKHRLKFDSLIEVSTIHSFIWSLIQGFQNDIRSWLTENLQVEITELLAAQAKGRGGKASEDRARKLESKRKRLAALPSIRRFVYSPTGDIRTRDSLNHAEVIKIGANFLTTKPMMQSVLTNRLPMLLIDESQDTNASLMDALLTVQAKHPGRFSLGLFGDTMQRIYTDGKQRLDKSIPPDWSTPAKTINHRCPARVIDLINKIRYPVDRRQQQPREGAPAGTTRLFIAPALANRNAVELLARQRMAESSSDPQWADDGENVKALILEHLMAARRMGFFDLFEPIYSVKEGALRTSLLEGTVPGLKFFSDLVLPLVRAVQARDKFAIARIARTYSPLLSKEALRAADKQVTQIANVTNAINELMALWIGTDSPRLVDVLQKIALVGLFEIPESLYAIAYRNKDQPGATADEFDDDLDEITEAWDRCLATSFSQVERYSTYVSGNAPFGTHQGVKGLEFPRVLVILDDTEARGFNFSYEKLFGVEPKSETDIKNEREGKETGIDRSRRLLYVTCSRSQRSLAIVAYSKNPEATRRHAIQQCWFHDSEIELLLGS